MSRIGINSKFFFPAVSSLFIAKGPYGVDDDIFEKIQKFPFYFNN